MFQHDLTIVAGLPKSGTAPSLPKLVVDAVVGKVAHALLAFHYRDEFDTEVEQLHDAREDQVKRRIGILFVQTKGS